MTMKRTDFPKGLEEGLNAHFGLEYKEHMEEWRGCYDVETSDKAFEEDQLITGFGAAQVKVEGDTVAYDDGQEGWTARYTHETIALAFRITEEAVEDHLYYRLGPKYARALARAMQHTKEIKGAAVFNNATTAGYTGGDAKTLLATDHPLLGGGTFSNKLSTPADLSETSIEDLLIQIRKAVDDRSVPIALRPKSLIIPPDLEYTATRLLRSVLRTGTGDNDINAIKSLGIFKSDPMVVTRLTDADAWFIRTDINDGLKHIVRKKISNGKEQDFETGDWRYKARERYIFGWSDPRGVYGSEGAA